MQRIKRPVVWLMMLAMVFSMLPTGLVGKVNAAGTSPATYFIPDIVELRNTALLTPKTISRENVYKTTNPTISVTGTYSHVSKDTLKVKIEQLNSTKDGWVPDKNYVTTGSITADPGSTNKFTAAYLNLFSGFNKITISGMQGDIERLDSFYVLFDKVPYVESLQLFGGGVNPINLNEGSAVVVANNNVSLQGIARNATQATIKHNNGTELKFNVFEDGTFFTPPLNLEPGLNKIDLFIQNASDSIKISREVYYYDKNDPFINIELIHNDKSYPILGKVPAISEPATDTSNTRLKAQLLLLDEGMSFTGNAKYSINGVSGTPTVIDEKVITDSPGVIYRLVTFETQASKLTGTGNQEMKFNIEYGNTTKINRTLNYKYLPGETVIRGIDVLPGYKADQDISKITRLPLNGYQTETSDFYIVVKTEGALTAGTTLSAKYLPLGDKSLSLEKVNSVTGKATNEEVYKVTGFSNGKQKVAFQYTGSSSVFNADISYVSKNYIYVENLFDGQTITINSQTQDNKLSINGEYIGFENIKDSHFNAQVFVNGISLKPDSKWLTIDTATKKATFKLDVVVDAAGPLVFGENKIVFTGTATDASGNEREIRKELKIYIIDEYVSNIEKFMPTLPVKNREPFDSADTSSYSQDKINRIFAVSSDFVFSTDKYKTSEQKYDLVLRGNGATKLNLYNGSQLFFSVENIKTQGDPELIQTGTFTFEGETYYYSFAGDQKDFILRIMDISFKEPGSHVYNLELMNGTGARTTKRLEIEREVKPFRIVAPQPSVGEKYIVNRNFIRFDIEAEGAKEVIIGKQPAVKRPDMENRFVLDYVGLKENKSNKIDIEIIREGSKLKESIEVYYASAVTVDSQFMATKPANKYSVFNKKVELSFPKGTILKSAHTNNTGVTKFYPDTKLLFGIADPVDGVVERRNDYGNIINVTTDDRTPGGLNTIKIPEELVRYFNSTVNTNNFSLVSDIYWISGGLGEQANKGDSNYKPATNGLAPYSIEGNFAEFPLERKVVPSQRGELTLSFDANIVDEMGSNVAVFRYTDREWKNIGGEVDTKKHTITVPFDEFGYYKVMKLRQGYSDITNHPWARNILNALYSKGIMKNIRFNEFGTDDQTTRGEFATLLVKGLNIPLNYEGKQTFFDIVPGSKSVTWDYEHIETAARAGIIQGMSEGFFGADQRITREQAAVMIARAMSLKLAKNDDKMEATIAKMFADSSKADFYARPAIVAVAKAKIMEGSPVTMEGQKKPVYHFNPKGNLTRAQAGKIAVELLKKSTKLFPNNLG